MITAQAARVTEMHTGPELVFMRKCPAGPREAPEVWRDERWKCSGILRSACLFLTLTLRSSVAG